MINILVAIGAEKFGAKTILEIYYNEILKSDDNWVFIVSKSILVDSKNIKIKKIPWVKKSILHRAFFYKIYLKRYKKINLYKIVSLDNIGINLKGSKNIVYLHQAIPFSNLKFNLIKEPKLWAIKNIYKYFIFKSLKNTDEIIVQSNFMKKLVLKRFPEKTNDIQIIRPKMNISLGSTSKSFKAKKIFFYPAGPFSYKNHLILINVAIKLLSQKIDFIIIFTFNKEENWYSKKLYKLVKKHSLPIYFVGYLDYKKMGQFYKKSILVFPSLLESFGLPLVEASIFKSRIIASDTEVNREVLINYKYSNFFDVSDSNSLFELMKLA